MKATAKQGEPQFSPIDLTITFESQEELCAFYAVMNYVPIGQYLRKYGFETDKIRTHLTSTPSIVRQRPTDLGDVQPLARELRTWFNKE